MHKKSKIFFTVFFFLAPPRRRANDGYGDDRRYVYDWSVRVSSWVTDCLAFIVKYTCIYLILL